MKRDLLSALLASCLLVATGCTFTIGHPPNASGSQATGTQQPIPSPSPQTAGVPGATGRIAVLDGRGTLTAFDADGSNAVVTS